MSTSTLTKTTTKYNPAPLRRHIRHTATLPGAVHVFRFFSMTREGKQISHEQHIDLQQREVRCECEDFRFRHAAKCPTLATTEHHCKHIAPALNWLRRHHFLEDELEQPCIHCAQPAEFPVADSNGEVVPGAFICKPCVTARLDDLKDAKPETPVASKDMWNATRAQRSAALNARYEREGRDGRDDF